MRSEKGLWNNPEIMKRVQNGDHKCTKISQAENLAESTISEGNDSTTMPSPEEEKTSTEVEVVSYVPAAHPAWNKPEALVIGIVGDAGVRLGKERLMTIAWKI